MPQRYLSLVCDLVIESNVALPELPPATGSAGCQFLLLPSQTDNAETSSVQWFHHWDADGDSTPWLSFAHVGDGYLLRFPGSADFLVSGSGDCVRCYPLANIPEATIRHLFLDQVLPLILSRRESLVLHASAIETPLGVLAFAGMSGQGKSTLAASFGQSGFSVLSDDCLVLRETVEGWMAVPSYPGVRLWPDSADGLFRDAPETLPVAHYTSKRRIDTRNRIPFHLHASAVRCIYFLDSCCPDLEEISISRLPAQEAFMKLANYTYNLDITDRGYLRTQFLTISRLTGCVESYALRYTRTYTALQHVRNAVLESIRA